MESTSPPLYTDAILQQLHQKDAETSQAFGRHMHYGYWPSPSSADGTVADFNRAQEEMTLLITEAGTVRDGMRLLDVGCGFGGTIASLNEQFSGVRLVGLNIDGRQLERARQTVKARPSNQIEFVEGDACSLPFPDASFDVVLAVEAIFHFPSRPRFFQETRRVLRPGGRLIVSDRSPLAIVRPLCWVLHEMSREMSRRMGRGGKVDSSYTLDDYAALAREEGFTMQFVKDITANILPTFPAINKLWYRILTPRTGSRIGVRDLELIVVSKTLNHLLQLGLLRYVILSFDANQAGVV